jgi:putative tryptophan/tyrosine transport system substrate-binding protein
VVSLGRREFVSLLGGAAVCPRAAGAQQTGMRRVGVLVGTTADDPIGQARIQAFRHGLQQLGWTPDVKVQIDSRWAGVGDADHYRRYAAELVALAPDVILASSGAVVGPLRRITRTVPIVFTETSDPVGAGFIESLARPGGNITGFLSFEYSLSAKWLELLKEVAPGVTVVGVLRDPAIPSGPGQWGAIQSVAPSLGVELRPICVDDASDIERAMTAFARGSNGGIIVTASSLTLLHRGPIITAAARRKLPSVYFQRAFVTDGGLMSYGADTFDAHRRAAGYVNRILNGENPADLPVQAPTKYELVINLKTARALGIDVPATLLARADEVIE